MASYAPKKLTIVKGGNSYTIDTNQADARLLEVDCGTISSLPITINNSDITSDMICVESVIGTKSVQQSQWSVSTANGSVTIGGSINGSTTLVIYLAKVSS